MRGDIIPPKRSNERAVETRQSLPEQPIPRPVTNHASPEPVNLPSNQKPLGVELPDIPPLTVDEPKPQKTSRRKILFGALAGIAIVVILSVIGGIAWYSQQLTAVAPGTDEKIKVTIEPGTDPSGIARVLKENNLIRNESAFGWYVRIEGKSGLLQSGSYRLSKSENVQTIVKHLTSGNTDTFSMTFLPGATLAKHRQALIDAGYDAAQVDAALSKSYDHPIFEGKPADADLEGYIYGETYNFTVDTTPEQILVRTFDQFETVVTDNDLVSLYKQQGFSLYQGITMASIIQREVSTADDAAQVAQVFKKRYDEGMQLGSDVTYQYIADKTGQPRSVDFDSPYNTRRYTGLPPGPIATPGLAALIAVGSPAAGDYVYFLSGDDDKTYFARTNEEHERNIREHCEKKCQII